MADEKAGDAGGGGLIATAVAAKLLMISDERIRQLVRTGYIPDGPRKGWYQLVPLVQGYIRFLKDEERSRSKVAAESGVKRAREMEIMQRVNERAGNLIDTSEAAAALDEIVAIVLREMDGLPASFTRDLKVRRSLQVRLDGVRTRILAGLDKAVVSIRAGDNSPAAEEEADA